jgi:hypothetical protein
VLCGSCCACYSAPHAPLSEGIRKKEKERARARGGGSLLVAPKCTPRDRIRVTLVFFRAAYRNSITNMYAIELATAANKLVAFALVASFACHLHLP